MCVWGSESCFLIVSTVWEKVMLSWKMSAVWAVLTRQSQHRLELAALNGAEWRGSTAHPKTLKLPLTAGDWLHLTPHLPHLRGGAAGLQTPGHNAQEQAHDLQAHRHAADCPNTPGTPGTQQDVNNSLQSYPVQHDCPTAALKFRQRVEFLKVLFSVLYFSLTC